MVPSLDFTLLYLSAFCLLALDVSLVMEQGGCEAGFNEGRLPL